MSARWRYVCRMGGLCRLSGGEGDLVRSSEPAVEVDEDDSITTVSAVAQRPERSRNSAWSWKAGNQVWL